MLLLFFVSVIYGEQTFFVISENFSRMHLEIRDWRNHSRKNQILLTLDRVVFLRQESFIPFEEQVKWRECFSRAVNVICWSRTQQNCQWMTSVSIRHERDLAMNDERSKMLWSSSVMIIIWKPVALAPTYGRERPAGNNVCFFLSCCLPLRWMPLSNYLSKY